MKLTNKKIVDCTMVLSNLTNKDFPIKISYAISKNISKIEAELSVYNRERQKLIDKYCVKDSNGENVVDENNLLIIADENLSCWEASINELLNIEVDIDIHKIKLDDLINCNCELKPSELMLINYMIEE